MAKTTQQIIPIEEIREGVVVLKNGELKLLLMVSTVNFDLKNEDEQSAILLQYQNFLNSLDFSVQIYVQSRKFNIKPYVSILEQRLTQQTNELLKIQTKEYINFVQNLTEANNIMSKLFFVVIPFTPNAISGAGGLLSKMGIGGKKSKSKGSKREKERFDEYRSQLEQRRDITISGLSRLGLKAHQLGTEELVELFYKAFNPGEQGAPIPQVNTTKEE